MAGIIVVVFFLFMALPGDPVKLLGRRGLGDAPDLPSTTHLVAVDRYGNGVSMTSTIESEFGSKIFVRGFLLNNQLTDFSFQPTDAQGQPVVNRVEPGKRPRSSMAPTIAYDAGGPRPSGHQRWHAAHRGRPRRSRRYLRGPRAGAGGNLRIFRWNITQR